LLDAVLKNLAAPPPDPVCVTIKAIAAEPDELNVTAALDVESFEFVES
jgi:hypothetical protein